ncbi:MAG: TraU family protein, partial [Legionellales bacterium]|nr:TraU family protein [Legionellales bacterium]
SPICACRRPPNPVPIPGLSIGYWQPTRMIEVTRTPYCMVTLGGVDMGGGIKRHGAINSDENGNRSSFYQVHYYVYPILHMLELLTGDFLCLDKSKYDIGYMTELDVTWNNDEWAAMLNPEALLFGSLPLQAACAADSVAANIKFPLDSLSWCAGSQGSLYGFTGHISNHNGGVEASLLLVQIMLAKLHRVGVLYETSGKKCLCEKKLRPVIKKSQYKTQMVYPKALTNSKLSCNPLGQTSMVWGAGREFPYKGEDFAYLIFQKTNCCVNRWEQLLV